MARSKPEIGGGDGLYTSTKRGSYRAVVRTAESTEIEGFFGGAPPSINSAGVVAFTAYRTVTARGDKRVGIFIAQPGKAVITVVQTSVPVIRTTTTSETGFWELHDPCLNDTGTVAFMAHGRNKGEPVSGVYAVKSAHLTTVARTGSEPDFYGFDTATAINRAGIVVFVAYHEVATIPTAHLYLAKDSRRAEPIYTPDMYYFDDEISLNSAGTVAFTCKNTALGNVACSVSPVTRRVKIVAQSPQPKIRRQY